MRAALLVLALVLAGCAAPQAPAPVDAPPPDDGAPAPPPEEAVPVDEDPPAPPPPPASWPFASGTVDGRRFAERGGLDAAAVTSLAPAWTFRTDGAVTGTPTYADGRVFAATWNGTVYAIDAATGDQVWRVAVGAQVDGSVTLHGRLALFGDAAAVLHAVDAATGAERWARKLDDTLNAHLYATPLVVDRAEGALVVQAVGSDQESARIHGSAPVDFRGKVVALDLATGEERWRTVLVPEGTTGAPVWGTPVYDAATGLVLFGTGNAYTEPATELTDAVVALHVANGSIAWSFQATEGDVFTQRNPTSPDHDFGSTGNVFEGADGRRLFGLGQKSSLYWAVDLATGEVAWRHGTRAQGEGIIGDAAVVDGIVVVPYVTQERVAGLDARDGTLVWERALEGLGFADPVGVPGAVFVTDTSGRVLALDPTDGGELWNATVEGSVFGGLSVADGRLYVPVVVGGFLGDAGAVVAFAPGASGAGPHDDGEGGAAEPGIVAMRGFAFVPEEVRVRVGETVEWQNEDPALHTVTAADGSFDEEAVEGQAVRRVFDEAGTFLYYCRPHASQTEDGTWQGMVGRVVVG